MNYFYAYLPTDEEKNQIQKFSQGDSSHIFFDDIENGPIWNHLIKKIKKKDNVYIPSIDKFSFEELDLKVKLETLKKLHVHLLNLEEKEIDIDLILEVMNFVETSKKERAKRLQRVGIDRALEKKYKGEGNFGRPKTHLPVDFIENIQRIANKEMTHEAYREMIGMKRSTYYKQVREVKDAMEKANKEAGKWKI
ncbi:hypothetical protein [[Eubacterium] hominis]|uniref:hypothetical protein n=1 Tax=[Eubacterium] hominis TaxID=2764325 RepID=UPI003A4E22F2